MNDILGITRIEKAFFNMGRENFDLQEYFFTYYSQKLILLNHFYPHVEGMLRGYVDHGPEHIIRIMRLYEKMLDENIPGMSFKAESSEILSGITLNFYEIYLLLCATLWHDIGNLLGRNWHNKKIIEILSRLKKHFFVDSDMERYALQIAEAHTGEEDHSLSPTDYRNEEINLPFLGALLRLTDELDEGEIRVDIQYYETMRDQIPEKNRIYWETSNCIKRIEPKPKDTVIEIRSRINQENLFKLFTRGNKEIALIDHLISKIDKINEERKYYMQFASKFIEFDEIILDITLLNDNAGTITFKFTNDQGYDAFWRNFPTINPEEKIKGYILQKEVKA